MIDAAISFAKIFVVFNALMLCVSIMTWVERRVSAIIQFRWGPNRVGPFGLLQPIADGIKFIQKEDIIPAEAHKLFYLLAPALSVIPALCAFAVIPFGPEVTILGRKVSLVILDLDGGLLWAFAATALGVYAVVLAGWSSNSKFSLMGGLRSSAQMISYELPLALSIVAVVLISGTLRPSEIVAQQAGLFTHWNFFKGVPFLGFLLFTIAGYAETNRTPFDLPEAEGELVAGYHTEYSGMRFAAFFMAEYINMMTSSALGITLFLGGWQLGIPESWQPAPGWGLWTLQILAFVGKLAFFQFLYVWVRWTVPRLRYDQLMNLGWKGLFPLSLANLAATACLVAWNLNVTR
ncbi:MAG TPA: NADH-quinone oxidoreductase subunit NuoH [Candidatus Polarisedimenticolaceae bacterium]|nr:NADH-quinone oxidoreductase subunit NuoH [Candidatus Polarisedimenticolaceae bacterium]